MRKLLAFSVGTGAACGAWQLIAGAIGVPLWMVFAGCTAYFVAGGGGINGLIKSVGCTYTGLFWAMTIFFFTNPSVMPALSGEMAVVLYCAAITGIVSGMMVFQSKVTVLALVPNTFIGGFSTFASGGDWKMMAAGLGCGALLGVSCDLGAKLCAALWVKDDTTSVETNAGELE